MHGGDTMARERELTPEEREELRRRAQERRARREREAAEIAGTANGGQPRRSSRTAQGQGNVPRRRSASTDAGRQAADNRRASQARPAAGGGRAAAAGARNPQYDPRRGADVNDPRPYSRDAYTRQAPAKSGPKPLLIVIIVVLVAAIAAAAFFFVPKVLNAGSNTTNESANNAGEAAPLTLNDTKSQVNSAEAEAAITLTLSGDHDTIVLKGESYIEPGSHAVERRTADISSSITVEGKVDTSKVGDYEVVYTATSSDGLKVSRTRTVHVVDQMDKDTDGIPVLMYHYVYSDEQGYHPDGAEENSNYILDTDLAAQLEYLTANDYYFPSYAELRAYVDGTHSLPAKSVILSFDDGSPDFLAYGIPVLEKYKVPATSFIVGVDNIEPCVQNPSEYVTYQSHSYDMHRAGGDYGHGGRIGAMTTAEIVEDLKTNISLLGSSDAFAYPFGDAPDDGIAAVHEAGILCAFTTDYDYAHVGDDPANLSRIRVLGTYDLDSFVASLG